MKIFLNNGEREIKANRFYIKSLFHDQLLSLDKQSHIQLINEDQRYNHKSLWIILSEDQDGLQQYHLRFGELITVISPNDEFKRGKKQLFLIEFYNTNINQQTFTQLDDNYLLKNQPCLLKNVLTDEYLCIQQNEFRYQQNPSIENCFQLIAEDFNGKPDELITNHPTLVDNTRVLIRNYLTGCYLCSDKQYGSSKNQNPMIFAIPSVKKGSLDKWRLSQSKKDEYELKYDQNLIMFYAQNLTSPQNKNDTLLFVDLSIVKPTQFWRIIISGNKPLSFGVPFLIQNSINGYFLTQANDMSMCQGMKNVCQVVLQPDITNNSLWIIFEHY